MLQGVRQVMSLLVQSNQVGMSLLILLSNQVGIASQAQLPLAQTSDFERLRQDNEMPGCPGQARNLLSRTQIK
jgi:hypothetical protein